MEKLFRHKIIVSAALCLITASLFPVQILAAEGELPPEFDAITLSRDTAAPGGTIGITASAWDNGVGMENFLVRF